MATKAFGYVRVSSKGQTAGFGPKRQREIIREFAAANGVEIVAFYEDAHTGTEADRPAFMEMLAAMMGNGVKTVVVESLDRFARELLIQISLLAKLAAEGLTLVAANTGENVTDAMNDDPMRKAMVQIQGVFAELDKNLLVRKLKKGREAKRAATGRCEGQKPFGHYDGESDVIDRIRQLRRKPRGKDRSSFADVAAELNAAGHRNRAGREWSRAMVHHVAKENGIA